MGAIEIEVDPLPCKWCERPLEQRRWWAPKRFCNRWHRLKFRVAQFFGFVADVLS
ncbi:hypothetical protein J7E93_07985 [Streptomyces sp. ISL-36]|uniref:hypothetical protein n=1 Tax=Streptomyces sp. ISL-36 TaxID=2819182 RepID=UPI001BEB59B2|nr:hypothetical protein [Streptomyces sp. ISL-36]MBT2440061.1 hypothetical protein [Streptomyces sp. ISL-36]